MTDQTAAAATTPTRAEHAAGLANYRLEGERLAAEIGNRGPIVLDDAGKLHAEILAAYWEHGYYIFEGVIDDAEITELREGVAEMLERAPVDRDATVDAQATAPARVRFAMILFISISFVPVHPAAPLFVGWVDSLSELI